jgi:hypothetical protein
LIALIEAHALYKKDVEFDEALRQTNSLIQKALSEDERFAHYSSGESVDTGMWGLTTSRPARARAAGTSERSGAHSKDAQDEIKDSLSDRIEIAIVKFLQKNPDSIYLEIEDDLYPQFPGLLTPSKAMIYAILTSYATRENSAWRLRPEDVANSRRMELNTIIAMLDAVGTRLNYKTRKEEKNYLWESAAENGTSQVIRSFYILASALVGRAINETPFPPEQTIIVIPGGRAGLIQYKAQRDPSLAARIKNYRLVKYRLLRTLFEVPVLTRETFNEQIVSDPLEKSKSQIMMF